MSTSSTPLKFNGMPNLALSLSNSSSIHSNPIYCSISLYLSVNCLLYLIICGNNIAFAKPCVMPNSPPILCAKECASPRETLEKAIPARVEALCIFSRATISAPLVKAFSILLKTSLMDRIARGSL